MFLYCVFGNPGVRMPDRLQRQPRRIVRGMSPDPGSSNRCRSAPPGSASGAASFASRPGTRLRTDCVSLRDSAHDPTPFTRRRWPAATAHDPRRLKALRIAPVAVAEDHRRIVEERERRKMFVRVQGPKPRQVVVVRAELQRVGPGEQRHIVVDLDHVRIRRAIPRRRRRRY